MRIIKILLALVVIVILGVVALVMLLPGERIAQVAADRVSAATGRSLEISGDVGISWYPVFGVTTGAVALGNAEWSERGPMFQAESASIGVELIPALTGDIRITQIELNAPDILLETSADGRTNWNFGGSDARGDSAMGGVIVEELTITDARVRILDHTGAGQDFSGLDISLRQGAGSSVDLKLSGKVNGDDIKLAAKIGDPNAYLGGGSTSVAAELQAFGNAVTMNAEVTAAEDRPVVNGNISGGTLDLSAFMGSESSGDGWSKAAINADALGMIDGAIGLSFDGVKLGDIALGKAVGSVTIERSRAVLTLQELQGFDGTVSGDLVANNRNGLSVGGDIRADGIELETLLKATTGTDRLSGKGDARVKFLASGNSVHAIMNSLSGDGVLNVGRGVISGLDLDQLFRGESTGGSTVFDALSGTFTMSGGVVNNNDLRLDLPAFAGTGAGQIGLGGRSIDYTFTPQIKIPELDVAVPVRIQGPWSGPKIWPDLEAVIQQKLEDEVEAIGEKIEDEVKDALGLGDDGANLEQVIQDKAVEGVLNLLTGGGN